MDNSVPTPEAQVMYKMKTIDAYEPTYESKNEPNKGSICFLSGLHEISWLKTSFNVFPRGWFGK